MLCYMAIMTHPNRAQPCGSSMWSLDVSLILRYRFDMELYLFWVAIPKRRLYHSRILRTGPRTMLSPPRDVLQQLELRPLLPRAYGFPTVLACESMLAAPEHHPSTAEYRISSHYLLGGANC